MCDVFQHVDAVHHFGTRSASQGNFYRIKTNKQLTNAAISYGGPNAGINFIHNHPPTHPRDLPQKFAPTMGLLHPSFCPGGGGNLLGYLPRDGHLSINDFCHFWNFHYNGKNWRLTTLWGFICCSEILYVLKENYSISD